MRNIIFKNELRENFMIPISDFRTTISCSCSGQVNTTETLTGLARNPKKSCKGQVGREAYKNLKSSQFE